VDALDYFPPSHSRRKELVRILQQLSNSLQTFQDRETGLWYQVVDQGTRKGNYLEGSASSMFVYALAKGVRKGYLDNSFLAVAQKGYDGIINQLIAVKENGEVDLLQVCEVAGLSADRDGSYDYYVNEKIRVNDPKGTGPFILASLELNR
jgi:unsaturated rhamnogalacturonyl hydrolase